MIGITSARSTKRSVYQQFVSASVWSIPLEIVKFSTGRGEWGVPLVGTSDLGLALSKAKTSQSRPGPGPCVFINGGIRDVVITVMIMSLFAHVLFT